MYYGIQYETWMNFKIESELLSNFLLDLDCLRLCPHMGTNSSCPLPLDVLQRKVSFISAPQRASSFMCLFVF